MTALQVYEHHLVWCGRRGPVEGWSHVGGRYRSPGHLRVLEAIVREAADRGLTIPDDALDRAGIAWDTALRYAFEHITDPKEGDAYIVESVIAVFEP